MIVNMITIAVRQKSYIERTLESLFKSDGGHLPVNLIMGSYDTSTVEKFRDRCTIVPWDAESEARVVPSKPARGCTLNWIRSLRYGDDELCVGCEDDISFVPDWYSRLLLTIADIGEGDYVLNLGQGRDKSPDKRFVVHQGNFLCGSQGIFYPSKRVRTAVANYLDEHINGGLTDALIGRYAKRYAVLYNTTPVLVHHIGQTSAIKRPQVPEPPPKVEPPKPAPKKVEMPKIAPPRVEAPPPAALRKTRRAAAETLLSLVRASLGDASALDPARLSLCDLQVLRQLAAKHGVEANIYCALRDRGSEAPADWVKQFKAGFLAQAVQPQLVRSTAEEIGAALAAASLVGVLTEGGALLRGAFGEPGLGAVEHVGLLVAESDVYRAGSILERLGYAEAESRSNRTPKTFLRRQSLPVELRWRLCEPQRPYVFDPAAVRASALPLDGLPASLPAMAPEHELGFLCLELDRRAVAMRSLARQPDWFDLLMLPEPGVARLARFYEIAAYQRYQSGMIDWDRFVATARSWAIDTRLFAALELTRRLFDVAPPAAVLRALDRGAAPLLERLAHQASFARDRADGAGRRPPRWLARWSTRLQRGAHAWSALLPPQEVLRAKESSRAQHLSRVVPYLLSQARLRLAR